MVIVHGTQRFRDRVTAIPAAQGDTSTTILGPWYATVLRWRPTVALFVNGSALLPVFTPFAPTRNLLDRFPAAVGEVLLAHGVPPAVITTEIAAMSTRRIAPTRNRSVVGTMNDFSFLADRHRDEFANDLVGLSVQLARTPCSPLYKRHISPDRELAAVIQRHLAS
jgi:uncharacterized protein DUF6933